MAKESKNAITRESCKKDLMFLVKYKLRLDIVLLAGMLLIFTPLILVSIYVAKHILPLGLVFALLCAIAPAIFVCRIAADVMKLRLVARDGFSIALDTVSRLAKGELKRFGEGRGTVNVIYFTRYGRYVAAKPEFDISSVGDEFYLVILHNKKRELVFAFHTLMYECNEVD